MDLPKDVTTPTPTASVGTICLSPAWITINISQLWLVTSLARNAEARLDGLALVWPPQVAGAESREGSVVGRGWEYLLPVILSSPQAD